MTTNVMHYRFVLLLIVAFGAGWYSAIFFTPTPTEPQAEPVPKAVSTHPYPRVESTTTQKPMIKNEAVRHSLIQQALALGLDNIDLHHTLAQLEHAPYSAEYQFFDIVATSRHNKLLALQKLDELKSYYQTHISDAELAELEQWLITTSTERLLQTPNQETALRDWLNALLARSVYPDVTQRYIASVYARAEQFPLALAALDQITETTPRDSDLRKAYKQELSDRNFTPIAITLRGTQIVVPVHINGYETPLLLDTGASITSIDQTEPVFSSLQATGEQLRMATANGITYSNVMQAEDFAIGEWRYASKRLATLDLGGRYGGLLGMDILSEFEFYIDTDNQQLLLKPKD